jgi:hypothetical protein
MTVDENGLRQSLYHGSPVVGRGRRGPAAGQILTITPLQPAAPDAEIHAEFHPGFWNAAPDELEGQFVDEFVTSINDPALWTVLRDYDVEVIYGGMKAGTLAALAGDGRLPGPDLLAVSEAPQTLGTYFLIRRTYEAAVDGVEFVGTAFETEPPLPGTNFDADGYFWGSSSEWRSFRDRFSLRDAPPAVGDIGARFLFGRPTTGLSTSTWDQRRAAGSGYGWRMLDAINRDLATSFTIRSNATILSLVEELQQLTPRLTTRAPRPGGWRDISVVEFAETLALHGFGLFLVPAARWVAREFDLGAFDSRSFVRLLEQVELSKEVAPRTLRIRGRSSPDFLRGAMRRGDAQLKELAGRLFFSNWRLAVAKGTAWPSPPGPDASGWAELQALRALE